MEKKPIEEAKKNLEKKIITHSNVLGIGVVFFGGEHFIEVAVRNNDTKEEIQNLCDNNLWEEHPVKIVIRDQSQLL